MTETPYAQMTPAQQRESDRKFAEWEKNMDAKNNAFLHLLGNSGFNNQPKPVKKTFFKKMESAVVHTVEHPVEAIKHVAKVIVKAEKEAEATAVKVATVVDTVGTKALAVSGKGLQFVEDNANTIKTVVNVVADVVEVVGVATGQPEITAAAEWLKEGADYALDLAAKAKVAQDVAEKSLLVARAIKEKKKLAVILQKTGDAMVAGGKASGNASLVEMGEHTQKGAKIVKKVADHSVEVHKIVKEGTKAIKNKDVKGAIKVGKKGFKEGKKIVSTSNEVKKYYKHVKKSKTGKAASKKVKAIKKLSKVTVGDVEKTVKKLAKEVKKKRVPSKYNIFVGKQRRAGKTFNEAVAAWNKQKGK